MINRKLFVTDACRLCVNNGWFTAGNIEQYNKMLSMVDSLCPVHDIAVAIWLCTENSDLKYIEHCLIECNKDFNPCYGCGFWDSDFGCAMPECPDREDGKSLQGRNLIFAWQCIRDRFVNVLQVDCLDLDLLEFFYNDLDSILSFLYTAGLLTITEYQSQHNFYADMAYVIRKRG